MFQAEVTSNRDGKADGELRLNLPAGWTPTPAAHELHFTRAGERAQFRFAVTAPSLSERPYDISVVARVDGQEFSEGYSITRYRDLETRYLYRKAAATVTGVDVKVPAGLKVGYVMGIGDEVPAALAQLGADVQLLGERELAGAQLSQFNAIFTGTRAYAVRQDLMTYNRRLLDYVRDGGNLIVLYNTQELDPKLYAPYPGELPRSAEEVSEEASPVEILAPDAAVLTTPNRITKADFDELGRAAGIEILVVVGLPLHADHRHLGSRSAAAERRLAARALREGELHLLCLRAASPVAVWRCRRVSNRGQSSGAEVGCGGAAAHPRAIA